MAETDVSHEFRREPGFSSPVFDPEHSHMLHKDRRCSLHAIGAKHKEMYPRKGHQKKKQKVIQGKDHEQWYIYQKQKIH